MQAKKSILVGVGGVVAVILVLVRPVYFIYACVGVLASFVFHDFFEELRGEFSLSNDGSAAESQRAHLLAFPALLAFGMLSTVQSSPITNALRWVEQHVSHQRTAALPAVEDVEYKGFAVLDRNRWILKHEITFDQGAGAAPQAKSEASETLQTPDLRETLSRCGWTEEAELNFASAAEQTVNSRWLPFKTINTIKPPPLSCGNLRLRFKEGSTVTISAPRFEVARTYPEATDRNEPLTGDTEIITIPVSFSWDRPLSVQLEVVSPILRNPIGKLLLSGAGWEPIKWILCALCGIFGGQIQAGLLLPFSRWIFRTLHIPFKMDPSSPASGAEKEPESV